MTKPESATWTKLKTKKTWLTHGFCRARKQKKWLECHLQGGNRKPELVQLSRESTFNYLVKVKATSSLPFLPATAAKKGKKY